MQIKPFLAMGALLTLSTAALAQNDPRLPVPNPRGAPVTEAPATGTAPAPAPEASMPVEQPAMATGEFIEQQGANETLATDLMGKDVLDSGGQQIAKISDLILDEQSRVVGVVLATGGFLGIGEHNVGVRLNQLTPNPKAAGYVVSLSREAIEAAPGFKTLADAEAERDSQMLQQQQQQSPAPVSPAPAVPAQ
jgi:hypothetical protein